MQDNKKEEKPQLTADLEGNYLLDKKSRDLKGIGLFYAPSGGNVHKVAKRIKQRIKDQAVDMFYIQEIRPEKFLDYQSLILVSSTLGKDAWNNDETDEWAAFLPGLQKINLEGRRVALVGLGDHIKYPNNFVDGMQDLADLVRKNGALLVGKTLPDHYTFTMSRAVEKGQFVGLPLDEDNEPEKTDARLDRWLKQVLPELTA